MSTTGPAPERVEGRALTLVAMSLGFGVVQLDVSVVNVAIRAIGSALGGTVSDLQWVVNAYTVTFAAFILTAGALGDRVGARRLFVAGFALFMVASAACGLAPSLPALIAARAVQGTAAAVLVPSSLTLLNHAYTEPAARGRAVGRYLAGASLALAGGPLIGGLLIAAFGWRAIFFINVPLALAGIALTLAVAPETTRSRERRVDRVGQPLAVMCLALLVAATIEGGTRGFGAPPVLGGFGLAALALAAFLLAERRGRDPMLPLSLFASRAFSVSAAIGLLVNIAFYGLIFLFSLFFQRVQGHGPLGTGLRLAPVMAAVGTANLLAGRLAERLGPPRAIALGGLALAAGAAGLLGIGTSTAYAAVVVQLALLGLGGGIVIPVVTAQLMGAAPRSRSGVAAGTLNTLRQTGSAIGVALFGALASGSFVAGARLSLAIATGLAAALAAGALLMRG